MQFDNTSALLRIDLQTTFTPGGRLPVDKGDEIMTAANTVARKAHEAGAVVVDMMDWHPHGHSSFASTHGAEPYIEIDMPYGKQTLWPDHAEEGTLDAGFHTLVDTVVADLILRKGRNPAIDSYSAFYENDHETKTGLAGYLRDRGIKRVYLLGLAYDFCVGWSALDACAEGFETYIVKDLCRAIDLAGSVEAIEARMVAAGVHIILSDYIS